MSELQIPPSLQPSSTPKCEDFCIMRVGTYSVPWLSLFKGGEWQPFTSDPRIVAAACWAEWVCEAAYNVPADEQANLWRKRYEKARR